MNWRYIPPNLATCASLVFGVIAIQAALRGRPIEGAWWGLLVTLTDKLDGLLARTFKSGSAFGAQLDSLADLVAFGVVPSTIVYAYFLARPELGWADGAPHVALSAICAVYVIAAAARLARFNLHLSGAPIAHYVGTPSTMTAGILLAFFLAVLKYSGPRLVRPEALDPVHLLGPLRLDAIVPWVPLTLLIGGGAMLSPLRVPRLGRTRHFASDVLLFSTVLFGYAAGVVRHLPEYLCAGGLFYLGLSVRYHLQRRGV